MLLVTGSTGFIGNAIANTLGDQALRLHRTGVSNIKDHIVFDLTSTNRTDNLLVEQLQKRNVTQIIHAAAITPWSREPNFSLDLVMARVLSEACEALRIDRLIFLSGWIVYDMQGAPPFDEGTPVSPSSPYGDSKLAVEQYFNAHLSQTALINLRLASVYGPGQTSPGLIPNLAQSATSVGRMTINALTTRRDYLYVDDLALAVKQLVTVNTGKRKNLNIGGGRSLPVLEVAKAIQAGSEIVTGNSVVLEIQPSTQESTPHDNQLNIEQAHSLGLLTKITPFEQGVSEYIKWQQT